MIGAKNRYISRVKALRKRKIVHGYGFNLYDNLHQYSKNKIHCSCPECSPKTRNKGRRVDRINNYDRAINYKISDLKKVQSLVCQEEEYFNIANAGV